VATTGALAPRARPFVGLARPRFGIETLILAGVAVVVGYLVLSPVALLVVTSFRRYDFTGQAIGYAFTLDNYREVFLSGELASAAWSSALYAGGGTLLAVAFGTALAWVVERTNAPFRTSFTLLAAATYFVPGVLMALGWNALANVRIGTLNRLLQSFVPVTQGPLDINTIAGMTWVFGTHLYPIVFLIMGAAFRTMDPALEEAAALSGAGVWARLRTVTLAVSRPAILSALLIVFVRGLESFDVPLILGLPGKINVLTTEVYSTATLHRPPELGISATLGLILLAVSIAGVYVYRSATARALAFATITGKGYRPQPLQLGRARHVIALVCGVFFFLTLALPLLSVFWLSLFPFVRQFSLDAIPRASFAQYAYVLSYSAMVEAFRNSIINSVLVATVVVLLTSIAAWIAVRSRVPGRAALDTLAFAPIGVPGTIMGVSVLLVYLTLPIPVYGTLFIVTIAHITLFLPYGMRLASDALLRIHPQLEEVSALSGAGWLRTYRAIVLPLILPGLLAAWVTILAASFRELSTSIFLASPQARFVSVIMYTAYTDGNTTAAAALGMVMMLVVFVLAVLARVFSRLVRVAA